jgi:putative colanic acid biosynthesis glycosyltransferase
MMIESIGNSGMDTRGRCVMLRPNAMVSTPALSVIVVCKNPGARLPAALASVWSQRDAAIELIVIDGASTDGTRDWLAARRDRINTVVSEPDSGVYHAMNKGLVHARGDWVYFLGADDRLVNDTAVSEMLSRIREIEASVVVGEACYEDGRVYRLSARPSPVARNFVHHQGALYRRALFTEHGGFDTTLNVMADYEFNLRLWTRGVTFEPIRTCLAVCGVGGLSDAGRWRGYREEITVRRRYFSAARCLLWDLFSLARYLRKRSLRSAARH